jgi:Flp pilus assembly protein TadG
MVELALTLPVFLLLLISVFDLGHVIWANNAIATAAREADRFAIVHGGTLNSQCPQGPLPSTWGGTSLGATECGFTTSSLIPAVDSRQGIKDAASQWLSGVGSAATVSVCYGEVTSCTGDVDELGATNERGAQVTVTVTSTIGLAAPALFGFGNFTLTATSTMLVNR